MIVTCDSGKGGIQLDRECKVVDAEFGGMKWTVTIERDRDGGYSISGRGTGIKVYVSRVTGGYLVSIPGLRRCGTVPGGCTYLDIVKYCDLENRVDAVTIAAAVRFIVWDLNKRERERK